MRFRSEAVCSVQKGGFILQEIAALAMMTLLSLLCEDEIDCV